MNLNFYNNIKTPETSLSITIEDWFNQIRYSQYSSTIELARAGTLNYDMVKESIPAVTYNFAFDGYKTNANIVTSTGYLYIDIDDTNFDIDTLDKNKVYAFYKSFGGKGYGIIVKVSGINLDNYSTTYDSICEQLDIKKFIDNNAKKATQYSVLSYDQNIFINEFAIAFQSSTLPPIPSYNRERAYSKDGGAKLRYNNLDEYRKNVTSSYDVNWDGYEYVECYIPKKKLSSGRYGFILSYTTNLLWLNPWLSYERAKRIVMSACDTAFLNKYGYHQSLKAFDTVYGQLESGKLIPNREFKKKYILFAENSGLDVEDKKAIAVREVAKRKTELSKEKLYTILESWDFSMGKITQRSIYKNQPVSKKTVEKYWGEFKDYVNQMNEDYVEKTKTGKD